MDGYDSKQRRYGVMFLSAIHKWLKKRLVHSNEEAAAEVRDKTDRYFSGCDHVPVFDFQGIVPANLDMFSLFLHRSFAG